MNQIRFSEFELDLELFKLMQDGEPTEIGPRSLDLLACLIQNRDRVLTPRVLRKEVWSNAALSPSAIPTCIRDLRRILGDDANEPRFIETVRGRGYRFIGEIQHARPTNSRHPATPNTLELPFVGRTEEMNILKSALQPVLIEAKGGVVLLRGAAGIGKSRLLCEHLASLPAHIKQFTVRATTIDGSPEFWPWTQIVSNAVENERDSTSELVRHAHALSSAFPEIKGQLQPITEPHSPLNRFTISTLWLKTIRSIAASKPLVLAFEDIHRADIDTLSLMTWLASELTNEPILIIATHRPPSSQDQRAQCLTELAASDQTVSLDIQPLTALDIQSMLPPNFQDQDDLSHALHYRTAGIPFYVTQLIRYLESIPGPDNNQPPLRALPSNAQDIVACQLSDLPEKTQKLLRVASVLGNRFSIHSISELLHISEEEIMHHLEPAERSMLLYTEGMGYAFAHALLRDALYQTLDSTDRRTLHLSVSRQLISQETPNPSPAEISDHLIAASPLADPQEILTYAVLAARDATTRFAYAKAQIYLQRALDQLEYEATEDLSLRADLLLQYARSQLYAGDRAGARSTLLEAARIARDLRSPKQIAECALQLAPDFLSIEVGVYDTTLVRLLQDALDLVDEKDLSMRAQLLARLSEAKQWENPDGDDSTERLSTEALELAHSSGDPHAIHAALSARAESLHGPDRVTDRLAAISSLQTLTRCENDTPSTIMQHVRYIAALLEAGDIAAFDCAVSAFDDSAKELNLPQFLWYPLAFRATFSIMQGKFSHADQLGAEFTAIAAKTGDRNVIASRACHICALQLERARAADVITTASDFVDRFPRVKAWTAGLGLLSLQANDQHRATQILSSFDENSAKALFHETGGGAGAAFLAEIAISASDSERIAILYDLFSSVGTRGATLGYGMGYFGCFARYSGILARALGLHSEALEHLRVAVSVEAQRRATVYGAHAQIDLASAIQDANGSIEEAKALIDSVAAEAESRNLPRLKARAYSARNAL